MKSKRTELVAARVVLVVAATVGISGCGWDRPLVVALPEPPSWVMDQSAIRADARWEIEWFDHGGVQQRVVASSGDRRVLVELPFTAGHGVYPVAATLCLPQIDWCYRPAGAVQVAVAPPNAPVSLRWDTGLAAFLLLRAARAGVDPAHFNVDRLAEAIRAYAGEDPWLTDTAQLTTALIHNRMRNALFVPPARDTFGVVVPAGVYYAESALAQPRTTVVRGAETLLLVDALPNERRSWYSVLTATRVTVWRDGAGHWFTVVRGPQN